MSYWPQIAVGLLALLAGIYVYYRIIAPFNQLREALRRLAAHDYRPVLLHSQWGFFRKTSSHVRRISELLQQLDRQIADEGFSLRAILSSMVEGVLITDRAQRIRLANEPLFRMFDLRPPLIDRTVIEVFRSLELQQAVERTLSTGGGCKIEISQTGKHFEVTTGALNPKPGGRVLGVVLVFHDITALKNLETVRRDFVANVSHEFRTPLTIINGYIETLLDGALEDPDMAEKSLRVMYKNGQRLTLLIEDLLTLSKVEHRAPQLDFHKSDLRHLLGHVLERLEPAISERRATVTVRWPEEKILIEADPRRLEQVFANLLENALRYGPAEGARIGITIVRQGEMVELSFTDNGAGIPYEDQPHVFERFYRVHKDRSRVAGGTGLGLSIVKMITLAHGGTVVLESVPGAGATFRVRLPLSQSGGQRVIG